MGISRFIRGLINPASFPMFKGQELPDAVEQVENLQKPVDDRVQAQGSDNPTESVASKTPSKS